MSSPKKPRQQEEGGVATQTRSKQKLARPRLYKVVLHNDDYTTMEFVTLLLMHVFHHGESTANAIMLNIHRTGVGIAGVYTYEVAETKVAQVRELAEKAEYPLMCTMEPDDPPDDEKEKE
jgi:ATP-dependent Clp protease adaptor protein ClpS